MRTVLMLFVLACAALLAGCVTVYENEEDANDAAHGRPDAGRGASYDIDALDVMGAARSWKRPPK